MKQIPERPWLAANLSIKGGICLIAYLQGDLLSPPADHSANSQPERSIMARKAKRRGRPPGSKSPGIMDVGQLRQHIERLQGLLHQKVSEQRAYFEEKLSELSDFASAKASRAVRAIGGRKGTRRKAIPKYRSRKDPKILWSGRGVTPIWMREEMKGTKLKKDDFLIQKR
jgi:DNA-binding protein H-NS